MKIAAVPQLMIHPGTNSEYIQQKIAVAKPAPTDETKKMLVHAAAQADLGEYIPISFIAFSSLTESHKMQATHSAYLVPDELKVVEELDRIMLAAKFSEIRKLAVPAGFRGELVFIVDKLAVTEEETGEFLREHIMDMMNATLEELERIANS